MKYFLSAFCICILWAVPAGVHAKKHKPHSGNTNFCANSDNPLKNRQPQWGFFDAIVDFVDWLTSPLRPVWGEYKEDGMRSGNPWPKTLFPRSVNDDLAGMVQTIRNKLADTNTYEYKLYKQIYNSAAQSLTPNKPFRNESDIYIDYAIAKNAAFVFMIGKRNLPDSVGSYDLTTTERNAFLNKALIILTKENTYNSVVDPNISTREVLDQIAVPFNGNWSKIQYRSKELIMLCQTYDILETCKNRLGLLTGYNFDEVKSSIKGFAVSMYRDLNALFGMRIAKNNYTLMPAAALGMAAIMLNTETTFLWKEKLKPKNWINCAMYNIHETMWSCTDPMSKAGGIYGFAEGPHYFRYSFESLLPFFKAFDNFVSYKGLTQTYRSPVIPLLPLALSPFSHRTRHPYWDPDYKNIYTWYKNLMQPDKTMPTQDDTYSGQQFGALAVSGYPEFSLFGDNSDKINATGSNANPYSRLFKLDFTVDYLASMNYYKTITETEGVQLTSMPQSGNFIINSKIKNSENKLDKHYLHLLSEKNTPNYPLYVDYWVKNWHTHEHPDAGSFTIMADDDPLLIDPAYYADNNGVENQVNSYDAHNGLPFSRTNYDYYTESNAQLNSVAFIVKDGADLVSRRNIEPVLTPDRKQKIYYEVSDQFYNPDGSLDDFILKFNGNGKLGEGTFTVSNDSQTVRAVWDHPCSGLNPNGKWGLLLESSLINGNNKTIRHSLTEGVVHGNYQPNVITTYNSSIGNGGGYHTRLNVYVTNTTQAVQYLTLITPYKCTEPPGFAESVWSSGLSGLLKKAATETADTIYNLHLAHTGNALDSISNPFKLDSTASVSTNAAVTQLSICSNYLQKFGWCNSYTHFKMASIKQGDTLIYRDTNYIIANRKADIQYKLIGKYRYQGYVQTDSGVSVTFLLPDLEPGHLMKFTATNSKTINLINYSNDSLKISGGFESGYTAFVIELADPCQSTCFFPPTAVNIVDTFDFTTGNIERLGHDLDIVPDSGWLNMTNGSKISICSGTVLTNRDSITMRGDLLGAGSSTPRRGSAGTGGIESPGGLTAPQVYLKDAQTGELAGSKRCMIIINDRAALVLDSGSSTHVGANSTILVKRGGTLFIKKGAMLEIGSADYEGMDECYGEVIAEDSAFVCIEDSSDLHFFINENDSVDKNRFFVTTIDSFKTFPSVNSLGIKGKFKRFDDNGDEGRFKDHSCLDFCDLKTIMPPDGINNRHFGWSNINRPHVSFEVKDTFCIGDTGYIDYGDKSLNEINYLITVQRVSFVMADTIVHHSASFGSSGEDIKRLNRIEYFAPHYYFDSAGIHLVKVEAINSCNETDKLIKRFYVRRKPTPAILKYSDTICAGQGNLTVSDTTVEEYPRYETKWHAHVIDTGNSILQQASYGKDWSYGVKQSTFSFPDFFWYGGFKYAISLSITNECGTSTTWDTVVVKPGAYIELSRPTVYATPVSGATQIQLTAHTPLAASFAWSPGTWLNRTDSSIVISTPTDSITYILTATNGACTTSDTVHINYNRYANAGYNDTLCYDSTHTPDVLVGFPYDMSLFLGALYYYNPSQFMSYYTSHNTGNSATYFRYFTHFMHYATFPAVTSSCPVDLFNLFTGSVYKELFFKETWYKTYYNSLTQFNDPNLGALDNFNSHVNSTAALKDHLDSLDNWGNIDPCIDNILTAYDDFVANHVNEITTSWIRTTQEDTLLLSSWDNYFVAKDNPTQSAKYTLSVIAPGYAEIDEITILLDTILNPVFVPVMQFDSTVYFSNLTVPNSNTISYEWHFNDGSGNSIEFNPVHTFPAFDSSYRVCLYATNECNTFMYCDTIWIDSLHQGSILLSKPESKPLTANKETNNAANKTRENVYEGNLTKLSNYPNPFSGSSVIAYEIWEPFKQAELRITNVLGQQVFTQKISKPIDKILIDGSVLADGIYYYSLITDGSVKQTKTMSVIH